MLYILRSCAPLYKVHRYTSSKIDKTKIVMINGSLIKVGSIAECSLPIGALYSTFDLHEAIVGIENQLFVLLRVAASHRFHCSVDIFSYSGPAGILGSDGKQNTA